VTWQFVVAGLAVGVLVGMTGMAVRARDGARVAASVARVD